MATINHKTYNEATETFKDFSVYDGKETLIFKVDGSEGNVGIGNSSPTATLDITGTLAVSGNSTFDTTTLVVDAAGDRVILGAAASLQGDTIEIHAKSNAGAISLFGRASDNGSAVSFRSNGATTQKAQIYGSDTGLWFATGTTQRVLIDTSGNVGIGNSSPTATLDVTGTLAVSGAATLSSSITASGIASLGIGETTELAFIGDRTTVNTRYIKFVRASALTDIVNIQGVNGGVGNTDIALQADGGNVGIGTSAPTRKLQVKGAVGFEATNSTNFWELYNYTDNTLRFNYNGSGSDEITITSAGNVGIGTSAPDTKLQVAATGATGLSIRANTSGDAFMRYYLDTVIASDAYVDRSTGNLNIRTNQNSSAIVFSTSAALIERVRITDNGLTFNGDTAAANALDDYEEGTWTPVLRGSSTAGIYEISDPYAVYTKIGRQVTAGLQFTLSSSITGGGSGYAVIEGLPFNKRANAQFQGICSFEGVAYSGDIVTMEFVSPSSATSLIYFRQSTSGASGSDLGISAFSANDQVKMTITYFV
jgi:hypothetical protein